MATSQLPQLGANADFDQVKSTMIQWQDYLNWFFRNLDSLNIKHLTAERVDTGILNTNLVTITASDGSYSYTIGPDGIVANNGSVDTLQFDLATGMLTIVSALIQSATGYPKVELNSANTLIGAYQDANNHVDIVPTSGTAPGLVWTDSGATRAYIQAASFGLFLASFSTDLSLQSGIDINLSLPGDINVNGTPGQTASIPYVKNVVAGVPSFGSMSFTKGILTSWS